MTIIIKCFKGAIHVDKFGQRYRERTTFIIKQAPFAERFFLPNGMQVDKHTCLEKINEKRNEKIK